MKHFSIAALCNIHDALDQWHAAKTKHKVGQVQAMAVAVALVARAPLLPL